MSQLNKETVQIKWLDEDGNELTQTMESKHFDALFQSNEDGCWEYTSRDGERIKCCPVIRRDGTRVIRCKAIGSALSSAANGDWFSVARARKNQKPDKRGITGWRPSPPDMRDFCVNPSRGAIEQSDQAIKLRRAMRKLRKKADMRLTNGPKSIDLSAHCSAVENQGAIGSCTAHAVVGLVEYFMRRSGDPGFEGSRLFVYKTARHLAKLEGDSGAWIRNALGAVVLCGAPPEQYWPYTDKEGDWDQEPDSFIYSLAQNFQGLSYYRFDSGHTFNNRPKDLLKDLKDSLIMEVPFAFGFYGFPSFDDAINSGDIPFPTPTEKAEWGHAIMAVGFDDDKVIVNPWTNAETKGAFKIRNSWGQSWGQNGYGWLPYEYVKYQLAEDFWALMDMEWIETVSFS